MINALPHDRALKNLSLLTDSSAMARLIGQALGCHVATCKPVYVRYKPQTSCLVQYQLSLTSEDGGENSMNAHIKVFADDRAERRVGSRKTEKMLKRDQRRDPAGTVNKVRYIEEVRGHLQVFPIDYDIPYLVKAYDPVAIRKAFLEHGVIDRHQTVSQPELIRYKPGRKALLRYDVGSGPAIYGKLHVDDRSERLSLQTQALIDAGLRTPPVIMTMPEYGFLAHAEFAGTQLASQRGTREYVGHMGSVARILRQLHDSVIPNAPVHTLLHEGQVIRETTNTLATVVPALRPRLERLADELTHRLGDVEEVLATNHGDFYDDQIIVTDDDISLIDLDELRVAHPLLDIGNMLAHLRSGAARGEDISEARAAFVQEVTRLHPYAESELALFEAIGLIKLAPGPFRRLEHDWPRCVEQIVALAEQCLVDTETVTTPVDDPALPQLVNLLDKEIMRLRLVDTVPDTIAAVEVVRHKPGRRAILRYSLESGRALYGKTFASKRGPKVHRVTETIVSARAFGQDVCLPKPVSYVPDVKLLLQESVAGNAITERIAQGDEALAARIAEALYAFHQSQVQLGRTHDLAKELSPLHARAREVGETFPQLRPLVDRCLAQVMTAANAVNSWRYQPVHRDFYHDQLLVDGDTLAVLDLDDASMSEPMIDVANFSAHLLLLALQQPEAQAPVERTRRAFVEHYRALDPTFQQSLYQFLLAATLVRLAGIHVTRANGLQVARGLLQASRIALQQVPRAA